MVKYVVNRIFINFFRSLVLTPKILVIEIRNVHQLSAIFLNGLETNFKINLIPFVLNKEF